MFFFLLVWPATCKAAPVLTQKGAWLYSWQAPNIFTCSCLLANISLKITSYSVLTTECVLSSKLLLPCADVIIQILTPTSMFNIILVSQRVWKQLEKYYNLTNWDKHRYWSSSDTRFLSQLSGGVNLATSHSQSLVTALDIINWCR